MQASHFRKFSHSRITTYTVSPEDDYECTECLGTYNDDTYNTHAEWIQCDCSQWIHEDCIADTLIGDDGTERICSNNTLE